MQSDATRAPHACHAPAAADEAAWEAARDVSGSGTPRMWLNFNKPFADLPPILLPPKPEPVSPLPLPLSPALAVSRSLPRQTCLSSKAVAQQGQML